MIPSLVYILCALTCLGSAILLWRGYRITRLRLLWWSALSFAIFAVANGLLFVDLVIFTETDLLAIRDGVTLVSIVVLLYGLIFESH